MNILLFSLSIFSEDTSYDHLWKWFLSKIPPQEYEVRFIVNEFVYNQNLKSNKLNSLNPVLLSDNEVSYILGGETLSIPQRVQLFFQTGLTQGAEERLKDICSKKLGAWTPDLICSSGCEAPAKVFRNIYPHALCLCLENGIFSRRPFNRTFIFDPFSAIYDSFFTKYANEIKLYKISKEDSLRLEKFKQQLYYIIEKHSPISETIISYKNKFRKTLLLPLVGTSINKLFNLSLFESDFDLVEYVLKNTPKDIGIFVTESDSDGIMTPEVLAYFRSKYPNFIFLDETNKKAARGQWAANSLHYLYHVDACFNTTSKTGITAVLWKKPIISLAKKYNDWIKDIDYPDNIEKIIKIEPKTKNNILHWYFYNYLVTLEDINQDGFLWNYINNKIEKYKTDGINFDYFSEPVNPNRDIYETILKFIRNVYEDYDEVETFSEFKFQRIRLCSHICFWGKKEFYKTKYKKYKQIMKK